jgi:hypothetical protein
MGGIASSSEPVSILHPADIDQSARRIAIERKHSLVLESNLVPREEIAAPIDEHAQHVERARTDGDPIGNTASILTEQTATPPVETEALEQEHIGRSDCVHALDSAGAG